MTEKDYCSKVCGSLCCKAHPPLVAPARCPMLDDDGLCRIYEKRIGFMFRGRTSDGRAVRCRCRSIYDALDELPEETRAVCCYEHPELLNC